MAEIKIRELGSTWVVRAGGAVIGETTRALELSEGDLAPVIYFPREDIAMAFLEKSPSSTHCPHKGDASYYSVQTKSELIRDAAWSYETPKDGAKEIAGHLAFYSNKVTVEQV
ncbi:DUF427 domain-containing protein [Oceaniglobus roseus]|uniref:DUF427 domain-containing protein n=1 Tax=Oceaniglobus roseus TaxID=1737570 RepID=UPI000C7F564D|nr:DUF427 domain-containing protein [Kandeliimicrobium roseum]